MHALCRASAKEMAAWQERGVDMVRKAIDDLVALGHLTLVFAPYREPPPEPRTLSLVRNAKHDRKKNVRELCKEESKRTVPPIFNEHGDELVAYPSRIYQLELAVASRLHQLMDPRHSVERAQTLNLTPERIAAWLDDYEHMHNIRLTPNQRQVVLKGVTEGLVIVMGGVYLVCFFLVFFFLLDHTPFAMITLNDFPLLFVFFAGPSSGKTVALKALLHCWQHMGVATRPLVASCTGI